MSSRLNHSTYSIYRRIYVLSSACLLLFSGVGLASATPASRTTPTGQAANAGTLPQPPVKWSVRWEDTRRSLYMGAVENNVLYVNENGGSMAALDATTGEHIWEITPQVGAFKGTTPTLAGDEVVFGVTEGISGSDTSSDDSGVNLASRVFAVDKASGAQRWTFLPEDEAVTGIAYMDGMLYVAGYSDESRTGAHVYALDAATGNLVWKLSFAESFVGPPVALDGVVYFGENAHALNRAIAHAVDAKTGKERWSFKPEIESYYFEGPVLADGIFYFGVSDPVYIDVLYALDARSGRKLWSYDDYAPQPRLRPSSSARIRLAHRDLVKSVPQQPETTPTPTATQLPTLPLADGPGIIPGITTLPTIINGVAYVGVNMDSGVRDPNWSTEENRVDYYLLALDARTGKERWRQKFPYMLDVPAFDLATDGKRLFVFPPCDFDFKTGCKNDTWHLAAFNLRSRRLDWDLPIVGDDSPRGLLPARDGTLYFNTYLGSLYAIVSDVPGMPSTGHPWEPAAYLLALAGALIACGIFMRKKPSSRRLSAARLNDENSTTPNTDNLAHH